MRLEKQKVVLECLRSGRYKVEGQDIYRKTKVTGEWVLHNGTRFPSGYSQVSIWPPRPFGQAAGILVYKHIIVYLHNNGLYPEGMQIDHDDRNNRNDDPSNLKCRTSKDNIKNSTRNTGGYTERQPIGPQEIKHIREMLLMGKNQSEIARKLNRKRLAVRYIIKKIESGEELKFEKWSLLRVLKAGTKSK